MALVLTVLAFDLGLLFTAANVVLAALVYSKARAVGRPHVGRLAIASALVPVAFVLLVIVYFAVGGGGE